MSHINVDDRHPIPLHKDMLSMNINLNDRIVNQNRDDQ